MRIKGLLLLLICIAGSSIVFVAFSNQRPSIQTLVTETHKQLRSFQVSSVCVIKLHRERYIIVIELAQCWLNTLNRVFDFACRKI